MVDSSAAQDVLTLLTECGQQQVVDLYNTKSPEEQAKFVEQLTHLNKVTPTGMKNYLERARNLLEASKNNVNPFDSYKPDVPSGEFMQPGTELMDQMEAIGLQELPKAAIVIIAGGLGERLGYSGIKVGLPVCTIEEDFVYLKYYAEFIHAASERARAQLPEDQRDSWYMPLGIMTSGDTHDRTVKLLDENNWFGLKKEQVDIVKQENVPALINNDAHLAIAEDSFRVITKPHGHGDIHNLLFESGVAGKWKGLGKEWMLFLQDTNALAPRVLTSILGVSKSKNWEMNTVTVPRKPGEAMGSICRLIDEKEANKELVINVEYNQLDALLRAKWNENGDIANDKGYSFFPGNTNTLLFKIPEYVDNLQKTGGVIPEFVNPKYANAERTQFKAPTRLECMMQDYPKLLTGEGKVGFTMYETWFCFSPAKNNLNDAANCFKKGLPSYGPAQAEYDFYNWANKMFTIAGAEIEYNQDATDYQGVSLAFGPKILLHPSYALTFQELKQKMAPKVNIGKVSTVVLGGKDTTMQGMDQLTLNGTLVATQGGKIDYFKHFEDKEVVFEPATESDPEVLRIRAFKPVKKDI